MKPTQEQLQEAERLFPMPGITKWYLNKFPKKQIKLIEVFLFAVGFVTTIIYNRKPESKYNNLIRATGTILFVVILFVVCVIFTIAWVSMRRTERKRAKWLGVSLQEYWDAINKN